jgi:protein involved in polysaccharide export with SLBB domain
MAYTKINPLTDHAVEVFNPSAGSASGSHAYIVAPFRGTVQEVGAAFQTTVTSNLTMAANIVKWSSSTASVLTEVITSTLGAFNSVMLLAGNVASVSPPSPAYVEAGDIVRITTSGGQSVTAGATIYTFFRRG